MPDGSVGDCSRDFTEFGSGFVRLEAAWDMGPRGVYRELALFGKDDDGMLSFWSFTLDGMRSKGVIVDSSDVHPDATAFTAEVPAGAARSFYWPDESGEAGFCFAVESKVKKGWNRFLDHQFRPA